MSTLYVSTLNTIRWIFLGLTLSKNLKTFLPLNPYNRDVAQFKTLWLVLQLSTNSLPPPSLLYHQNNAVRLIHMADLLSKEPVAFMYQDLIR